MSKSEKINQLSDLFREFDYEECSAIEYAKRAYALFEGESQVSDKPILDRRCKDSRCHSDGEYKTSAVCSNCGWKGIGVHSNGHIATGGSCPNCGCMRMSYPFLNYQESPK